MYITINILTLVALRKASVNSLISLNIFSRNFFLSSQKYLAPFSLTVLRDPVSSPREALACCKRSGFPWMQYFMRSCALICYGQFLPQEILRCFFVALLEVHNFPCQFQGVLSLPHKHLFFVQYPPKLEAYDNVRSLSQWLYSI